MSKLKSFEDRHFGVVGESWFRRTFKSPATRVPSKLAIIIAVGLLSGVLVAALITAGTKAFSADPQAKVLSPAGWAVEKFKDNKMGRTITPDVAPMMFRDPAAVRGYAIRKIEAALIRQSVKEPAMAASLAASGETTLQRAIRLYGDWRTESNCTGASGYHPYTSGFNVCEYAEAHPESRITLQEFQIFGSFVLCGAGAAVSFFFAPPSAGATLAAGIGGLSCFWSAWLGLTGS